MKDRLTAMWGHTVTAGKGTSQMGVMWVSKVMKKGSSRQASQTSQMRCAAVTRLVKNIRSHKYLRQVVLDF